MNDKEIVQAIIEKAINNGWEDEEGLSVIEVEEHIFLLKSYVPKHIFFNVRELFFEHDFAKAFWKWESMERRESGAVDKGGPEAWESYLQQMVLEENPIEYLKKFL